MHVGDPVLLTSAFWSILIHSQKGDKSGHLRLFKSVLNAISLNWNSGVTFRGQYFTGRCFFNDRQN